jgi:hypothetical protein
MPDGSIPRVTERQAAVAYAYLKAHGYLVAIPTLQDAMQTALCQDTPRAQTESSAFPESRRMDRGGIYFGD